MKWLGIALVIYLFINGFIEELKGRVGGYIDNDDDYEEDDYNDGSDRDEWDNSSTYNQKPDYSSPKFDTSFISHSEPPEYHHKTTNEYEMLVRVRGDKYARQETIIVEGNTRSEAKQKARNMGYEIIRCN